MHQNYQILNRIVYWVMHSFLNLKDSLKSMNNSQILDSVANKANQCQAYTTMHNVYPRIILQSRILHSSSTMMFETKWEA